MSSDWSLIVWSLKHIPHNLTEWGTAHITFTDVRSVCITLFVQRKQICIYVQFLISLVTQMDDIFVQCLCFLMPTFCFCLISGTTLAPCQGRLPRSQSLSSYSNVPSGDSMSASGLVTAAYGMLSSAVAMSTAVSGGSGSLGINILRSSSSSIPSSCLSSIGENATESSVGHPGSTPSTPLSSNSQAVLEVEISDCKVCWERVINCVLYTCGHMCLCFDCAMTIRGENGLCPICRQAIVDVIKIYKS